MTGNEFDYKESRFREKMLEHVFLSEVLQYAWRRKQPVGILRAEVDRAGYDLVLECGAVTRYIQLKSSTAKNSKGRKPRPPDVNGELARKLGGCVVWIWLVNEDEGAENHVNLEYRFLGKAPSEPPDLGSKKGKRIGFLSLSGMPFEKMDIGDLIDKLLEIPETA